MSFGRECTRPETRQKFGLHASSFFSSLEEDWDRGELILVSGAKNCGACYLDVFGCRAKEEHKSRDETDV